MARTLESCIRGEARMRPATSKLTNEARCFSRSISCSLLRMYSEYPFDSACTCAAWTNGGKNGLDRSGTMSPKAAGRPVLRARALRFRWYPISSAALRTRETVSSFSRRGWLNARDAVEVATPARLATSTIVGGVPRVAAVLDCGTLLATSLHARPRGEDRRELPVPQHQIGPRARGQHAIAR